VEEYACHNVFGPPEELSPGTKVLKTSTVCQGTYCNGELIKHNVCIVVKGFMSNSRVTL
jgi:hypothetical protein